MNLASILAFLVALFKAVPVLDKWLTKLSKTIKNIKSKRRASKTIKDNVKKGKAYEDAVTDADISDAYDELP